MPAPDPRDGGPPSASSPSAAAPGGAPPGEGQNLLALRLRLAVIGALLILAALVAVGALIWNRHAAALADARTTTANLALVLARQADGAVVSIEAPLSALLDHGAVESLTPDNLAFTARMHALAEDLPHQTTLLVTDAGGKAVAATGTILPCTAAWIARSVALLSARPRGDPPLRATSTSCGESRMMIARSLHDSRGDFAGALLALINPRDLLVLPPELDLPGSGAVVLFGPGGLALLARPSSAPLQPALAGHIAGYASPYPAVLHFDLPAEGGHPAQIVALHALAVPSLALAVVIDRDQALAEWRRDSRQITLGALICTACIILLLHALLQQIRHVAVSQASLAAANAGLRQKSHELEITLANMEQGLVMMDRGHHIAVYNARAAELLDLPADLLAARPTFDEVMRYQWERGEFVACSDEIKSRMLAGVRLDLPRVYERRRPDGQLLEIRNLPLPGGGVVRTYTDVTARALEEQRFRQIVAVCPLGVALLDPHTSHIVHINPAGCTTLGRPPEGLVGHPWQEFVHPADRRDGLPPSDTDIRLLTGDGRTVVVRLSQSSLPGGGDAPPMRLVIGEDVTRQRDMEVRLHQAQRLEAVGQLTGGVAHDFNNLLGIIMLDAELLAVTAAATPDIARLAGEILDASTAGAELTHRLLAFARRQALQPRVIDLAAAVAESARLLRRTLGGSIEIRLAVPPALWPVCVDPTQLGTTLLNLALNARDAMPEGGRIVVSAANRRVGLLESSPELPGGDYVCLCVEDSGIGMSPEVLARAVEPFFTTKPPGTGSGLGLSMIYGFAHQSGGALTIESRPEHGTAVRLLLPRAAPDARPEPPVLGRAELPGGTETILLVDDNDAVRRVTARQLDGLGYRIIEAASGAEALDRLREGARIDLLFTDVVLAGGFGGAELVRAARAGHPDLKVLYTSGFLHFEGEDPAPLIRKPYRRHILAEQVRAVLDEAD